MRGGEGIVLDAGGRGDCGFLSIIASLVNHVFPASFWEEEVRAMRDLIGCYWRLENPPKSQEGVIQGCIEPDPMFPQEDVTKPGVFMQDKDIILLVHLMDLEEITVGEQRFLQDKPWGRALRVALRGPLETFWEKAWALVGTTHRAVHIYHSDLHFKAIISTTYP